MNLELQSVSGSYTNTRNLSWGFKTPVKTRVSERPGNAEKNAEKTSPVESSFDRIIKKIKRAKIPLEKKERLIRWLWAMSKAESLSSGSSSGSPQTTGEFEQKIYQLIQLMEATEKYNLDPEKARRHEKRIDDLIRSLRNRDAREAKLNEKVSEAATDLQALSEAISSLSQNQGQEQETESSSDRTL